jgi:hypothetical protein
MKSLFAILLILVANAVAFPFIDWFVHSNLQKRNACGDAPVNIISDYLTILKASGFCSTYLKYTTHTTVRALDILIPLASFE